MIIVFSGTGNSLLAAAGLQRHLGGDIVSLEGELLVSPAGRVLEVPQGEDVVWVFPVYSWGVPPVVGAFIRLCKIKCQPATRHYMVCTCGDDTGYTDSQWSKLIGRRGWNPRGAFSVQMPNTYVLMKGFEVDSPETAAAKLASMPARLEEIAAGIKRGFAGSDMVRGSMAWLKTSVVNPLFRLFCMSSKPFHATDACTECGLCARGCPMGNITLKDGGKPCWGNTCALCLRCYHVCPAHAVAYGTATVEKGQKQVYKI